MVVCQVIIYVGSHLEVQLILWCALVVLMFGNVTKEILSEFHQLNASCRESADFWGNPPILSLGP